MNELYLHPFIMKYGEDVFYRALDPDEIRRTLDYDENKGILVWGAGTYDQKLFWGKVAKTNRDPLFGLRSIKAGKVSLPMSLYVWTYHAGRPPAGRLLFLDRNINNSRIFNLEDATGPCQPWIRGATD